MSGELASPARTVERLLVELKSKYDVVILGAGHNGLVAASYLGFTHEGESAI